MNVTIDDELKLDVKITEGKRDTTILFANGSIFNYKQYDMVLLPVLKKLLKSNYRLIQYDYVGIGGSSPLKGEFDFLTIAHQQLQLMDALGLERVHLFGYSKGALINQLMTSIAPARVVSMVAYGSPNLADPNSIEWSKGEFQRRVERVKQIQHIWDQRITTKNYKLVYNTVFVPTIFRKEKLSYLDRLKNAYIQKKLKPLLIGTQIDVLYKLFNYYSKPPSQEEQERYMQAIRSIQTPTLLMHGKDDEIIPISASRLLHKWIKNSRLKEFKGFSHSGPMLLSSMGKVLMHHYAGFLKSL